MDKRYRLRRIFTYACTCHRLSHFCRFRRILCQLKGQNDAREIISAVATSSSRFCSRPSCHSFGWYLFVRQEIGRLDRTNSRNSYQLNRNDDTGWSNYIILFIYFGAWQFITSKKKTCRKHGRQPLDRACSLGIIESNILVQLVPKKRFCARWKSITHFTKTS